MNNTSLVSRLFPVLYRFCNSFVVLFFLFSLTLYILFFLKSLNLLLSLIALSYFPISIRVEKYWSRNFLLGPFSLMTLFALRGVSLGLGLYTLGISEYYGEIPPEITKIQIAFIIGFPFQILGYWLCIKNVKFDILLSPAIKKRLTAIGKFFVCFAVVQTVISISTGSWDRTTLDFSTESSSSGISGFFTAFTLLSYLGYLLFPLLLKESNKIVKIFLSLAVSSNLFMILLTGNRGLLLFPVFFIIFGMTIDKTIKIINIKKYILIFIIASLILIPLIDTFRNSEAFMTSRVTNFEGRLNALSQTLSSSNKDDNKDESSQGKTFILIGKAFYGRMNDINIYSKTPSLIPHAGWENFEALLYIFIPQSILPSKPSLYDGHKIAVSYLDNFSGGWATISFDADLYRRFGWHGIILGNFIFGLFYGFFVRFIIKKYNKNCSAINFVFILLLFTFYQPNNTVLTTAWTWIYAFPKYMIGVFVIFVFLNTFKKNRRLVW